MSRKLSIGLISGLSLIVILSCLSPAQAAYDLKRAILFPGNPLYFIKEFSRNVQRALMVDAISKAELELGIADSLASEVIAVEEKNPAGLDTALRNYSEDLDLLKGKISDVKSGESAQNIDRFLNSLYEKSLVHDRLIEEVSSKRPDAESETSEIRNKITETVSFAENKIGEGYDGSERRMAGFASGASSVTDGVLMLEFMNRLENYSGGSFGIVKNILVSKISGIVRSDSSAFTVAIDKISAIRRAEERIKSSLDISERVPDTAIAGRLTAMESDISGITKESAEDGISGARSAASKLSGFATAFSSGDIMPRIEGFLDEAERYLAEGDYTSSFISARRAEVIAVSYLIDLSVTEKEIASEVIELRSEYESLLVLVGDRGITPENSPVIWSRLEDLKATLDTLNSASSVREAEELIAEIRNLIDKPVSESGADKPVFCPTLYDPVCGKDGKNYGNSCIARSSGTEVDHKGDCVKKDPSSGNSGKGGFICTMIYSPVCGDDGVTYANSCIAESAGAKVRSNGACPSLKKTFPVI